MSKSNWEDCGDTYFQPSVGAYMVQTFPIDETPQYQDTTITYTSADVRIVTAKKIAEVIRQILTGEISPKARELLEHALKLTEGKQ